MIILTQDRKAIHNFDNVLSIQVEGKRIIVYDEINDSSALGTYATAERAKEVLQKFIGFFDGSDFKLPILPSKDIACILEAKKYTCFTMPEK